ncbi:MAG TPA: ZIP family metal transporter [Steroidobacteraceae bacterium]|nr:ZIP family metal transporter [Steroidobacteraceae bacterium]
MSLLLWIIGFTTLGGALSALAASLFLLAPEKRRTQLLPHFVSFATGALLGAALLTLLPHAMEGAGIASVHSIGLTLLVGILIFFLLEKFVLWRHCHVEVCEVHDEHGQSHHHGHSHGEVTGQQRDAASARLILIGDGFHNIVDGVLIAAAFMTNVHLGVVTALAVIVHEIPQEVGDLAILIHGGMSRSRALLLNLLSSLTSVLGGVIAYFALGTAMRFLPYAIALAASSFLYIAVADLIPGLHRRVDPGSGVKQFALIVAGVTLIYFTHAGMH